MSFRSELGIANVRTMQLINMNEADSDLILSTPQIRRESAIRTLALGFSADPVARWIWEDPYAYFRYMPEFISTFCGEAFNCSTAVALEGYRAVAMWLPPGTEPDSAALDAIFEVSLRPEIEHDVAELFVQMETYHDSQRPCWYLPMIAADPAFMGRGYGGHALAHALRWCDNEGAVAYLESSNRRNIGLYRRFGFELIGEIQAGASPKMYPMVRAPCPPHQRG